MVYFFFVYLNRKRLSTINAACAAIAVLIWNTRNNSQDTDFIVFLWDLMTIYCTFQTTRATLSAYLIIKNAIENAI